TPKSFLLLFLLFFFFSFTHFFFFHSYPLTQVPHRFRFLKGEGREVGAMGFVVLCILHFSPCIINIYN
ncbi:hypothetical protein GW17_00008299, partial [Ensete ventricosum]